MKDKIPFIALLYGRWIEYETDQGKEILPINKQTFLKLKTKLNELQRK